MTQEITEEIGICSNTVAELLQHDITQVWYEKAFACYRFAGICQTTILFLRDIGIELYNTEVY